MHRKFDACAGRYSSKALCVRCQRLTDLPPCLYWGAGIRPSGTPVTAAGGVDVTAFAVEGAKARARQSLHTEHRIETAGAFERYQSIIHDWECSHLHPILCFLNHLVQNQYSFLFLVLQVDDVISKHQAAAAQVEELSIQLSGSNAAWRRLLRAVKAADPTSPTVLVQGNEHEYAPFVESHIERTAQNLEQLRVKVRL